ncbi:COG4695 Phage-related protein [uncultured Caudovirales phage]|uniref:COG4695 Phage-related protein n=1 Tax=uncultured Caudovirales phage TaxID=2100421 RepID=A0A6J5R8P2_9CAUD|nr:COG4695 Phage-related protein [uncultured Caudovirales phage]CAB4174315.1 COG4695 Phage-related protein [uncultured Caudovirales phage]CAB4192122.1 COG4695 Phage-related protein [uncultured Caudovirales phage]
MLGNLLRPREEQRAVSFQTIFASGGNVARETYAGTVITYDTSLKIGAVYACVRLLADTISTLPVDTFYREGGSRLVFRPKPIWVETPDIGMAREDFLQQAMVSLLLDGNVFIRIFRGRSGEVTSLTVLDPTRVEVRRNPATREVEYAIDGTAGAVLTAAEVLHITELRRPGALRGVSRIEEVKQALGLASALEEFSARFFGQGSTTQGLIEWPGNLTREQAKDLADGFEEGHKGLRRAHRPGVLFGGAKFVKTGVDPNEAQMLESRQFAVEEIARIFRCPLHLLQVSTPGAMSYASVEQNAIQFAQYTLRPIISKFETALSTLLPGPAFVKFNLDAILRGDIQTRFAAYSTGQLAGFLSVNDVRRLEDYAPAPGGDDYRVPLANVNLAAANIVETDRKTQMLTRLIMAGFDPAEALKALDMPPIMHTGIPVTSLQSVASINPADPASVYP